MLTRIWLPLAIIYVVWGSTYLGIRVAIDTIPPLLMTSARFLLAGVLLYGFALWRGEVAASRPGPKQWLFALAIGGALLVGGNGGVVLAERTVPTGVVALIVATVPLWMALIDRIAFHHRLNWRVVTGLVVGFGGVAFLLGSPGPGRIDPGGALLALLSPVCWATGSVFARHARLSIRPMVGTAMQMLSAGVVLAIFGTIAGEWRQVHLSAISLSSVLALAYLVVFGSLIAFSAYVWLLKAAPLSLVSTYAYVNPVVAVLLGWAFLSEPINPRILLAGAVIVAAVALIVSARLRPARTQPAVLAPR
jgi:drug/metabolite transporter (DMT)-like permease